MDTDKEKASIMFRVFFSYDYSNKKHIHYLILNNESFSAVTRKTLEERSELLLAHHYEHVINYKVADEHSSGHPTVTVFKVDGSQITLDLNTQNNPNEAPASSATCNLSQRSSHLNHQVKTQEILHHKILQEIGENLKFGPATDNLPKSECLVRYGDPWRRIHNDQLVIGIPVINGSTRYVIFLFILF